MVFRVVMQDGYEVARLLDGESYEYLYAFPPGERRGSTWTAPRVEVVTEDEGELLFPSDAPYLAPGMLALRPRAVDELAPVLGDSVEFLPLRSERSALHIVNPLVVIDALDEPASEITRFQSGKVMTVERYVLKSGVIAGKVAFRLGGLRVSDLFVGESFVRAWKEGGLDGLHFQRVAESDEEPLSSGDDLKLR